MNTFYEAAAIPALAAVVYTIIDITKTALGGTDKFNRFIPLISCVLGALCGVVAFYCVPGVFDTQNLLVAIVLGAASGLSATGTNLIGSTAPKSLLVELNLLLQYVTIYHTAELTITQGECILHPGIVYTRSLGGSLVPKGIGILGCEP